MFLWNWKSKGIKENRESEKVYFDKKLWVNDGDNSESSSNAGE